MGTGTSSASTAAVTRGNQEHSCDRGGVGGSKNWKSVDVRQHAACGPRPDDVPPHGGLGRTVRVLKSRFPALQQRCENQLFCNFSAFRFTTLTVKFENFGFSGAYCGSLGTHLWEFCLTIITLLVPTTHTRRLVAVASKTDHIFTFPHHRI